MNRLYVLDTLHMKTADAGTIEKLGISQDVLMEKAALAVVERIKIRNAKKVLCVCGSGNNGADALAVARILLMQGIRADVFLCKNPENCKTAVAKQYNIFIKAGGKTVPAIQYEEYDIIVDGILGIGMERTVEGRYAEIICEINHARENGCRIISVDIPSGIHTDTGSVLGNAVTADETVTFAYYKPGLLLYPGAEYCGTVSVADIGISHQYFYEEDELNIFTADRKEPVSLPARKKDGNKGTFGRVLIIAGSATMYGACYLSALAALRMGVGLVDIYTHEINRISVQNMLPEAILHTYDENGIDKAVLKNLTERANCVVIGPGLSTDALAMELVSFVFETCDKTIVADADALNCISMNNGLLSAQNKFEGREVIITPHPGEFSRLTGLGIEELKNNYIEHVMTFAKKFGITVVGKGAGTVVSNGKNVYINRTGNDGMATAGSGDVLSGIIGGLCAQGECAFEAAWKGVFLHGKAGDTAVSDANKHSILASDIANALKKIIKD